VKIKQSHIIFWIIAAVILIANIIFFRGTILFFPFFIVAFTLAWIQFAIDILMFQRAQKDIEQRFPDFVRNLVNAIKSGMPAPTAIVHISERRYGALTPHVKKLAAQIEWSVPLHKALINFANSTNNPVIKRSVATVIEAERSGGNMEDVLNAITDSLIQIQTLKEERKAHIHAQTVQSYIIFFVFLAVLIVIQNSLVPYLTLLQGTSLTGLQESDVSVVETGVQNIAARIPILYNSPGAFFTSIGQWLLSMSGLFMVLAAIQGIFTGLVIGKLAEGELIAGMKHSIILTTIALLVMSVAFGV